MLNLWIALETIVALGDSVTLGVRRDGSVKAEQTFVSLLGQKPGRKMINAGIGGNNTDQMLERLNRDVLSHQPDTVIIMAGLNDAAYVDPGPIARTWPRVSAERFEANLTRIVRASKKSGAKVILLTPNPMTARYLYSNMGYYHGNDINHALGLYHTAMVEVSRNEAVCLVDVFDAMIRHPERDGMLPDGVHPNPDGHKFIYRMIENSCRE